MAPVVTCNIKGESKICKSSTATAKQWVCLFFQRNVLDREKQSTSLELLGKFLCLEHKLLPSVRWFLNSGPKINFSYVWKNIKRLNDTALSDVSQAQDSKFNVV